MESIQNAGQQGSHALRTVGGNCVTRQNRTVFDDPAIGVAASQINSQSSHHELLLSFRACSAWPPATAKGLYKTDPSAPAPWPPHATEELALNRRAAQVDPQRSAWKKRYRRSSRRFHAERC